MTIDYADRGSAATILDTAVRFYREIMKNTDHVGDVDDYCLTADVAGRDLYDVCRACKMMRNGGRYDRRDQTVLEETVAKLRHHAKSRGGSV